MIVISLTNVPDKIRGYTSRYLIEMSPSVYVGTIDAKTRDKLWDYISENCGKGYSTMVFSAEGSQGFEIVSSRNSEMREVVEFDGVRLIAKKRAMMDSLNDHRTGRTGWSKHSYNRRKSR